MGRGTSAAPAVQAVPVMGTDFEWSHTDEPHATRRKQIVAKYPEVKTLFGPDPWLKWKCSFAVLVQVVMCTLVERLTWWQWLLCTYMLSGTINHAMTLAMHEISHNLAFRRPVYNRFFGMVANLPLGIPASASFTRYHMDHHKYQGEDLVDTDVPTAWEGRFFRSTARKVLWVLMQPLFYGLRPLLVAPRAPCKWEIINLVVQVAFDAAVYLYCGPKALLYLLVGTLLGMGLHPLAGHFVAEHYSFVKGQETYSYYGPLNWVSFNVGYHNEHHDFPYIPGSRLPLLRAMAPEFYDNLPRHSSWPKVIWTYIFDAAIGPFTRVKRQRLDDDAVRRLNPTAKRTLRSKAKAE